MGLGPSAHSYNGSERSWNVSNNQQYLESISKGKLIAEKEILNEQEKFNEWLMTGLRTQFGCDLQAAKEKFDALWVKEMLNDAANYFEQKKLQLNDEKLTLTFEGKLIADRIISDLMRVN